MSFQTQKSYETNNLLLSLLNIATYDNHSFSEIGGRMKIAGVHNFRIAYGGKDVL